MFAMASSERLATAELLSLPRLTSALTSRSKSYGGGRNCQPKQNLVGTAPTHVCAGHGGRGVVVGGDPRFVFETSTSASSSHTTLARRCKARPVSA